jgi:hypothetical protein
MNNEENERLNQFKESNSVTTKGPLALLIQLSRTVRCKSFPLNPDDFLTDNKGQVSGLGGSNLKKVLKDHGVMQTLAAEGGRTSRGNMGLMIKYIDFLNTWHDKEGAIDFEAVEAFWAEQVRAYFSNQPFVLSLDSSYTTSASLNELFEQAIKRQKQNPGTQYLGTVLQHLVGAKLSVVLPPDELIVHGVAVADSPTERGGDFALKNTVIHCTTAPGELLLQKCKANIKSGAQPVIITVFDRVNTALNLAVDAGLGGRIEVWDVQQFLSTNIEEHSLFDDAARHETLAKIIAKYNEMVSLVETDPGLRIELSSR